MRKRIKKGRSPQLIILVVLTSLLLLQETLSAGSNEMQWEDGKGCASGCEYCDMELDVCARCAPGKYYNQMTRVCQDTSFVTGCKYYSYSNKCSECKDGYRLIGSGCTACISGCSKCDSDIFGCDLCSPGNYKNTNANPVRCDSCLSTIGLNCLACDANNPGQCTECEKGYGFGPSTTFTCSKCTKSYCAYCDGSSLDVCFAKASRNLPKSSWCVDGAFWIDEECQPCPDGCSKCDSNGVCTSCNTANGKYMWMDMTCYNANIFSSLREMIILGGIVAITTIITK